MKAEVGEVDMKASVKTVGFASWDPEAVILLCTNKGDMVHVYPAAGKKEDHNLEFSDDRRNIVLLTNVDRRYDLTQRVEDIYRLIIFAPPEQLARLEIPVMDMVSDDGPPKVFRQRHDTLRKRIEDEAVSIDLTPPSEVPEDEEPPLSSAKKPKKKSSLTLRSCMEELVSELDDFPEVSIKKAILQPTLERLAGRMNKQKYREKLRDLLEDKTVGEKTAKKLFRWVEGLDGSGPELSEAVKAFGRKNMTRSNLVKTAEEFGVTPNDLFLVLSNEREDRDNSKRSE